MMVNMTQKDGQKIKVNRQQVNINAYVRVSQSFCAGKYVTFLRQLFIFVRTNLYFLCKYFFIPVCH